MLLPLLILLAGAPDAAKAPAPTPREMAQLFFLAGDLSRAIDAGRNCLKSEKKKCEAFYRALVEYEALIRRNEQLTPAEVKSYLEWDRLISPKEPGKLTKPVIQRYIEEPIAAARIALQAGDKAAAKRAAERVLQMDPKNADAKEVLKASQ
jgi:tetratricopeptide (TPR) repeat protein